MEHRRPGLVGPLVLITIGVLVLLSNLGLLPFSFWEIAWRFWPVLLIFAGLEIVVGRRSLVGGLIVLVLWIAIVGGLIWLSITASPILFNPANSVTDDLSQSQGDVKSASVELRSAVSTLVVTALTLDTSNLMQGTFRHTEGARITKSYDVTNNEARLVLKEDNSNWVAPFGTLNNRWDVALNPTIPLTLRVTNGVGRANLDLSALKVTLLSIEAGVGTASITTPQTGITTMRVSGGVGSTAITIPQGVSARIRVHSGIGSTRVDNTRFPKSGNVYQSADYASAANRIDIGIESGVGSTEIR